MVPTNAVTSGRRIEYQSIALIVLVSGLALLPSWLHYDIIANDGAFQYIPVARLLLQGSFKEALLTPQLPLFPLLIAGMSALTGMSPELAGRTVAAMAFVAASLGIYRLGMLVFHNRLVALLAVVFMLTNLELIADSVDCLKESLLVACIIWATCHILLGVETGQRMRLCAGIILLLAAALLRSTALFFMGAWLLVWAFHRRQGLWLRLSIIVSPLIGICVLWFINPHLPIFIRSYNLALIFNPDHTPLFLLKAAGGALREFFITGNPLIILFAAAGLYLQRRNLYARYVGLVLALYLLILSLWGFVSGRYLLAPIVCVYPLAAYGVYVAWFSRKRFMRISAVLALLSCIALWGYQASLAPDPDKLAHKEAGMFIASRLEPGQVLATNRPRVAFYAQGSSQPLSAVQLRDGEYPLMAVDIRQSEALRLKSRLDQIGARPDAVFRSIYVYLPKP